MARLCAIAGSPSDQLLTFPAFPVDTRAVMQQNTGAVLACFILRADCVQKTGIMLGPLTQLIEASLPHDFQVGPLGLRRKLFRFFRHPLSLLLSPFLGLLLQSLLTRLRIGSSLRLFGVVCACKWHARLKRDGRIEHTSHEPGLRRLAGYRLARTALLVLPSGG